VALDVLHAQCPVTKDALVHTASRTGFRGRWEKISDNPLTICDIGHNEHGLKYNFAQLERMKASGEVTHLIIVYGSVADKDVDAVIHLMPEEAIYVFTQAHGKRALPAETAMNKYLDYCKASGAEPCQVYCVPVVTEAMTKAVEIAASIQTDDPGSRPMIYVGGSTYVVSEAVSL
jgi:dihydrofolate synthase/folylpolyglutamate synthase